jgi:uncharacterized protein
VIDFSRIIGFDWDRGNTLKNERHGVSMLEAEELFFLTPLVVTLDESHSKHEPRFRALGQTLMGRRLTVIFTLRDRDTRIRVISARAMSRKERAVYEQEA